MIDNVSRLSYEVLESLKEEGKQIISHGNNLSLILRRYHGQITGILYKYVC